jgi:hypothetical protein
MMLALVRQDNSIIAAFKVQKRLDLEDMRTGFNYLQRFAKILSNVNTNDHKIL